MRWGQICGSIVQESQGLGGGRAFYFQQRVSKHRLLRRPSTLPYTLPTQLQISEFLEARSAVRTTRDFKMPVSAEDLAAAPAYEDEPTSWGGAVKTEEAASEAKQELPFILTLTLLEKQEKGGMS